MSQVPDDRISGDEGRRSAWDGAVRRLPIPVRQGLLGEALVAWASEAHVRVTVRSEMALHLLRGYADALREGLAEGVGRSVELSLACDQDAFPPREWGTAQEAAAEEIEQARQVGELAYYARVMAQTTLPHRRLPPGVTEYVRENGQLRLTILAPSRTGLPYGSIPRLLLAWVTTEAVRTGEPRLVLGTSMNRFLARLDLCRTGGPRGDITRLRRQAQALFSSTISATFDGAERWTDGGFRVASQTDLWWDPRAPEQEALWESSVTLTAEFFAEVTARPVPVDMAALRQVKDSPMALDAYVWMAHRMSYLRKDTTIPWPLLELQFGAGYARTRDFRRRFATRLQEVRRVYPAARWDLSERGLLLHPSPTPVRRVRLMNRTELSS